MFSLEFSEININQLTFEVIVPELINEINGKVVPQTSSYISCSVMLNVTCQSWWQPPVDC